MNGIEISLKCGKCKKEKNVEFFILSDDDKLDMRKMINRNEYSWVRIKKSALGMQTSSQRLYCHKCAKEFWNEQMFE